MWADPRCSRSSTCRPRRVTICTATAPDAVRTLRTHRETIPEGCHPGLLSDHFTISATKKPQARPRTIELILVATRVRPG